jgi:hypothetical protein
MTDHHWIILVLQGFLGMTEERAICYQLVRLRHCAKKVAALKQWTCLKLEVKGGSPLEFFGIFGKNRNKVYYGR